MIIINVTSMCMHILYSSYAKCNYCDEGNYSLGAILAKLRCFQFPWRVLHFITRRDNCHPPPPLYAYLLLC